MKAGIRAKWERLWASRWVEGSYRLRIDLDPDHENILGLVPRVLQALERATAVADALFGDACHAVTASHADVANLAKRHWPPRPTNIWARKPKSGFDVLREMGLSARVRSRWRGPLSAGFAEDVEDDDWRLRSFDLTGDIGSRDTLLWNSIVWDLPLFPRTPDKSFLLHPTEDILLHVYDERGMDVIAGDAETLRPFYRRFDDWLLDHDRPRMKPIFGEGSFSSGRMGSRRR